MCAAFEEPERTQCSVFSCPIVLKSLNVLYLCSRIPFVITKSPHSLPNANAENNGFTFNNKQSYVLAINYICRCARYNVLPNNTINMATQTWPMHDTRSAGTVIALTWFNHSRKSVHSGCTLDLVLAYAPRPVNFTWAYLSRGIEQYYPAVPITGCHFERNQQ